MANSNGQSATKLRASDGAVLATINVGTLPYGVVFDGTYVWVTAFNYVAQLRVSDGAILHTFNTAGGSAGIAFDGANLWIAEYDAKNISKM